MASVSFCEEAESSAGKCVFLESSVVGVCMRTVSQKGILRGRCSGVKRL